ncbi:MAG TPA: DUF5916 domain-containing protein [Flavilitoribacter sp.]|nr:DUF5916 domain-containing protein [Flavilitoribacter sp.]HMQ86580.1 DUF5916 domain-containing protein [Flavilitoribacter sp.]
MHRNTLLTCALLASSLPFSAVSQPAMYDLGKTERPSAQAVFLEQLPAVDGEVLNDAAWQNVPSFGQLIQLQPNAGRPATEKTAIYIAYSVETFYLAVVCYDAKPQQLVVSDARRDAILDDTDSFQFILDTYHDNQNGFVFGTNSIGVEYDAQINNEGVGNNNANRQQGGTIGGVNINWDASWEVKTQVGDYGWSAEFAIPFRTLRYAPGKNQTWGVNFQRNIRKTNEIVFWAPMPLGFDLNRLSLAGSLTGLDLVSPGNLKLIPYVLGQAVRDYKKSPVKTEFKPEAGADLKYSITPALTLDLTYNTDFAQVEVDDQQVNLDRFNLFFPEKRPFFLENAGLFSVGSPGEVDLFFSRRIGIGDNGQQVPIIGGARLSGKVKRTNVGFLSMFTDDVSEAEIQPNNFTVARVSQEFAKRSAVGAAFITREGLGEDSGDYNRTYAADGKVGLGKKALLSGFYAHSQTPGIDDNEHAFKFQATYDWNQLNVNLAYTEVGEGFNPEVGFLLRQSFRKPEILVLYRLRPNGKFGLLELRPHISYRQYSDFNGFLVTGFLHVDNHWEFESGLEIHTGINFTTEGVLEPFEISEGVTIPAGAYRHREAQILFITNPSKRISFDTRSVLGGFFGGRRLANSGTMRVRFGDRFNSAFTLSHNDISLPGGDFSTFLFGGRLSYSFTPRIFIQSLVQYNSVIEVWSANIRFGWLQQANTGLFVVYNEGRDEFGISGRNFAIKYSRVFDIIK